MTTRYRQFTFVGLFLCGCVLGWFTGYNRGYVRGKWRTMDENWQASCTSDTAYQKGWRIGHNDMVVQSGVEQDKAYDRGYADGSQNEITWFRHFYTLVPKHHN